MDPIRYVVGLDLGQASDHTALAVLKRIREPEGPRFTCQHLERFALGTSYPAICSAVADLVGRPELRPWREVRVGARTVEPVQAAPPLLALDRTGVGRAVADLFIAAGLPVALVPVTITAGAGHRWERAGGCAAAAWVGKRDLVGALQVGLQTGVLKVVPGLPLAPVLMQEFLNFRLKVTESANETFNGREGTHDDILLATALALWLGTNVPPTPAVPVLGASPLAGWRGTGRGVAHRPAR